MEDRRVTVVSGRALAVLLAVIGWGLNAFENRAASRPRATGAGCMATRSPT